MFGDVWRQQCRIYVPAHVLGCKNGRMPYSYWRRLPLFVATTLLLVLALQLSPSQCPKFKQHVLQEGSSEIENVAFNAALTSIVSLALNVVGFIRACSTGASENVQEQQVVGWPVPLYKHAPQLQYTGLIWIISTTYQNIST
jgi:hypothetical protein